MANVIAFGPGLRSALMIALRNEPSPESLAFVTTKFDSRSRASIASNFG